MTKLVVDTSILIDHLRDGRAWRNIVSQIDQETELYIPTIVIFELFSGRSTQEPSMAQEVRRLIGLFQKIELTQTIAKRAGEFYRDMTKKLDVPDYIIAASAFDIGGTVVTLNKKHFVQIPGLVLYPL